MSLLSPDQAAARQSAPALVDASDVAPGARADAVAPWRRRSIGVAGRLLLLTIGFVLLAMGLFYASRLTAYRENWLRDRLMVAHTAMTLFGETGEEQLPPELADKILDTVNAKSIVVALPDGRRLVAEPQGSIAAVSETVELDDPTSATALRRELAATPPPTEVAGLPNSILTYMRQHHLYGQ